MVEPSVAGGIRLAYARSVAYLAVRAVVITMTVAFFALWRHVRFIADRPDVTGPTSCTNAAIVSARRSSRAIRGRPITEVLPVARACAWISGLVGVVRRSAGRIAICPGPILTTLHARCRSATWLAALCRIYGAAAIDVNSVTSLAVLAVFPPLSCTHALQAFLWRIINVLRAPAIGIFRLQRDTLSRLEAFH